MKSSQFSIDLSDKAPLDVYLSTFGSMDDIYSQEKREDGGRGQKESCFFFLSSQDLNMLKCACAADLEQNENHTKSMGALKEENPTCNCKIHLHKSTVCIL